MIKNLENKLRFIELLDEMKNIERAIYLKSGRKETDAEHSFHIAMIVCVFLEDFPELDALKCIKMALYHDLVEIFAWDTILFDEKAMATKKDREEKALIQLEEVLWTSSFSDFKSVICEYEDKKTKESRFVYQIDKLHPMIQIIMEWWKSWEVFWITKKRVLAKKYEDIDDEFWLVKILDKYTKIWEDNDYFLE